MSQTYEWQVDENEMNEIRNALLTLSKSGLTASDTGTLDASSFTQGRSLVRENLMATLQDMTVAENLYALWAAIPKHDIDALYAQWNERSAVGDNAGGEYNKVGATEAGAPAVDSSTLARITAPVAHYRDTRNVTDIMNRANTTVDPMVVEDTAAARKIIQNIDSDLYFGNRDVFAQRMYGIFPQVYGRYPSSIVDGGGLNITSKQFINKEAAIVNILGGRLTDAFYNPSLQPDIDRLYSANERFVQPIVIGSVDEKYPMGVTGGIDIARVNTGHGPVNLHTDPGCSVGRQCPTAGLGTAALRPTGPASATSVAAGSGGNIPAGAYYYKVAYCNEFGEAVAVETTVHATVTAGQVVTITPSGAQGTATGIVVYRSAKDAADASDCRFLGVYPWAATVVDSGAAVPGSTCVFMFDQRAGSESVAFGRFTTLIRKKLAETDWSVPFGYNLSGTAMALRPRWIRIIKNVVPVDDPFGNGWDPLGVNGE